MRFERGSLKRSQKIVFLALVVLGAVFAGRDLIFADSPGLKKMVMPQYVDGKQLVLPEGYRKWIFVGASIGLSYSEQPRTGGPGTFAHIYMQPEAFEHFNQSGQFPEGTMLVMELHKPEQNVSINKQGYFEGDRVAIEVALKDRGKFEEGWAYFDFANGRKKSATAFPKASCFNCHQQHAAIDNVFTQFYPVLRDLKKDVKKD